MIRPQAHSEDRGPGAGLLSIAQPPVVEVVVQFDAGMTTALQKPAEEGVNLLVDLLPNVTHLRVGEASVDLNVFTSASALRGGMPMMHGSMSTGRRALSTRKRGSKIQGKFIPGEELRDLWINVAKVSGLHAGAVPSGSTDSVLGPFARSAAGTAV
jgi:hypothetical protein